jgi:hypothetical protein
MAMACQKSAIKLVLQEYNLSCEITWEKCRQRLELTRITESFEIGSCLYLLMIQVNIAINFFISRYHFLS